MVHAKGVKVANRNRELAQLQTRAKSNDAHAQAELAARLALGDGVQANLPEAVRWYTKASRQGLAEATFNLATLYARGEGVKKSWAQAMSLLKQAEDQGSTDASILLGEISLKRPRKSSAIAALTHFSTAALNGDVRGFHMLAVLLVERRIADGYEFGRQLLKFSAGRGSAAAKKTLRELNRRARADK